MELKRSLGTVDAGWMVAGSMIGSGIFWAPGLVAEHLPGGTGPLIAWTLGGLLALCGAAVYAELGARIPGSGGDYRFLTEAFGPVWGFLTGWAALILTFSAAAAANSLVAFAYLQSAIPALEPVPRTVVGPAFVILLTLANAVGARFAGRTTAWLTAIPVLGLLGIFGFGLLRGDAQIVWPQASGTMQHAWPLALGAALIPVYFAYSGWNTAAYVAAEMRDPERNLSRGLVGGTAFVMAVYLAINLVLLLTVPQAQLAGSATAGGLAARSMLGPVAERGLSLMISVAVLGSANVTLMAGARIYYAMARDGLAPRLLTRVSSAGVPSTAIWISGIWTALLAWKLPVEALVNWATLAILLMSSLAMVALFVLRRRGVGRTSFRCPGYPVTPVLYLIASLGVAYSSAVAQPRQAVYGILLVALGFPAYFIVRRIPLLR